MADPLKRGLGMDAFGLFIHVGITICALGFVAVSDGPEEMYPLLTGASLLMLAVRRWLARREPGGTGEITGEAPPAGVRIADLEQRVAELESVQERIFELEERLDFSERLLAQGPVAEPRGLEGPR
jgi:hypothetical protein